MDTSWFCRPDNKKSLALADMHSDLTCDKCNLSHICPDRVCSDMPSARAIYKKNHMPAPREG